MSVASFIASAGTVVAIEGVQLVTDTTSNITTPSQTSMGGVNRSTDSWVTVGTGCDAVPCLINVMSTTRVNNNNQTTLETLARVYFNNDPVPGGLNITHRLRVVVQGKPGPTVEGVWIVYGVQNPMPFGDHIEVQAMRIGIPT